MSRRDEFSPDPPDPDDFERRLEAKLEERRAREAGAQPSGWSQGVRYGSEFAGGVLVGAGLGYLADRFLGWSPWGLLAGIILGFAAGSLNVIRAATSMNEAGDGD